MKKLIYSWIGLIMVLAGEVCAQEKRNVIQPERSPAGIYLHIGAIPLKGTRATVWRNTGKGFEVAGSLSLPLTKDMLRQRMETQSLKFPDYYAFNEQTVADLWQMIQTGKQDSITRSGIPVVLLATGASFLDTTANLPDGTRYRVQVGDQKWDSEVIGSKVIIARYDQLVFHQLQPANEAIRAEWRMAKGQQPPLLRIMRKRVGIDTSYVVLNSDLGFEKTVKGDSISVHLSDTTVLAGISYLYYLSGKDYLGRVITRSDTVRSIAGNRATVAGVTKLVAKAAADSSGIELRWNKSDVYTIRSIRVFRSAYYDSAYVQIAVLPPSDTSWIDRSGAMGANYYYQVIAQGDGDFAIPSLRIFGSYMDDSRLLPPSGLRASAGPGGTVLGWNYHSYMNLLGFRVYRTIGGAGKFEAVSDLIPAGRDSLGFVYVDKDASLTGDQSYAYAVAAVGRNFKESPLSAIVQNNQSEKGILPAPLQVRSLQLDNEKISITWQDMASLNPGVTGYHVYRKAIGADSVKGFVRLTAEPIMNANEFEDDPGKRGAWQYAVRSVNQNDSSGYSQPVAVRLYGIKPLPPGRVYAFSEGSNVVLSWDGTQIPGIGQYHIYRASTGTAIQRIGSVSFKNEKNTFEDKQVDNGNLYFYYVTAEKLDGTESERSREVSIRLKN